MLRKEWPLIMYTLLAQLAAGMFIILAIARMLLLNSSDPRMALQLTRPGIILVGPIIAIGIVLSLFHLGNPTRAYRSISNLSKSWLSWEILLSSVFLGLWFICFWMDRTGMANQYLLALTGLAGLLNVFCMALIYFTTGKPGWNRTGTFVGFFGSLIILGTLGSVWVFSHTSVVSASIATWSLKPTLLAILVLAIELVSFFMFLPKLKMTDTEDTLDQLVSSAALSQTTSNRYRAYTIMGWFLSFLGVALLFIHLQRGQAGASTVLIAFILAFIGELLERSAFFSLGFGD